MKISTLILAAATIGAALALNRTQEIPRPQVQFTHQPIHDTQNCTGQVDWKNVPDYVRHPRPQ